MKIEQFPITPTYKKENGLWVLNLDTIEIPFDIKERSVVSIPPGQIGGNHKHPRQEAFIGLGEGLELVWIQDGRTERTNMNPEGKLFLFFIPPYLQHAVINNSKTNGILIEFADKAQEKIQNCQIT